MTIYNFQLALLTAYLVMAATFNSLFILYNHPNCAIGYFWRFGIHFISGQFFAIYFQIALIILIGISTKNSILILTMQIKLELQVKILK